MVQILRFDRDVVIKMSFENAISDEDPRFMVEDSLIFGKKINVNE